LPPQQQTPRREPWVQHARGQVQDFCGRASERRDRRAAAQLLREVRDGARLQSQEVEVRPVQVQGLRSRRRAGPTHLRKRPGSKPPLARPDHRVQESDLEQKSLAPVQPANRRPESIRHRPLPLRQRRRPAPVLQRARQGRDGLRGQEVPEKDAHRLRELPVARGQAGRPASQNPQTPRKQYFRHGLPHEKRTPKAGPPQHAISQAGRTAGTRGRGPEPPQKRAGSTSPERKRIELQIQH